VDALCKDDLACRFRCCPKTNLMQKVSMLMPAIKWSQMNTGALGVRCFHWSRRHARPLRTFATAMSGMADVT
jgi:hypothetical protein